MSLVLGVDRQYIGVPSHLCSDGQAAQEKTKGSRDPHLTSHISAYMFRALTGACRLQIMGLHRPQHARSLALMRTSQGNSVQIVGLRSFRGLPNPLRLSAFVQSWLQSADAATNSMRLPPAPAPSPRVQMGHKRRQANPRGAWPRVGMF